MKKNKIITAAATVLFLAGISQLIRTIYGWEIIISEWEMPIWVSLIVGAIAIFLSYNLLKLKK